MRLETLSHGYTSIAGGRSPAEDAHPALLNLHGVWGTGISKGLCCSGSTNDACLHLYVSANSVTVLEIAKALNTVLADVTDCLGIEADVPGFTGPRCAASDPRCEPETCTAFDPVCCWTPKYDPAKGRVPTLTSTDPIYDLELPQLAGECTFDGECVRNGCGNHCTAYSAPTFPSICPCYYQLHSSFCGCVDGACVWFEQH